MIWLFDIDGTLIRSGGAGGLAMGRALAEVFGVPAETRGVTFSGQTDRGIVEDLFQAHNIEVTETRIRDFFTCYLEHLQQALTERDGMVLPGARECLDICQEKQHTLGLLTGNMFAAAKIKLEHFGLWNYFEFGGYGDTEPQRNQVAEAAVSAARRRIQDSEAKWHTPIVVGDTPNDIRCARSQGLPVVCVPTGEHTWDELASHNPDYLIQSLHECVNVVTIDG